jgi:hypothetical protein
MERRKTQLQGRLAERFHSDVKGVLDRTKALKKPFTVKNISLKGVCVESEYPFPLDEKVEVILMPLSSSRLIRKKATIVWCEKTSPTTWKAGLKFERN